MNPIDTLRLCIRLGHSALLLLSPDLALALSPLVELLTRAAGTAPAPTPAMLGVS